MIYVTGDTHGEFNYRFSVDAFPEQREMTKDDYVIICGDFGGIWNLNEESKNEKYWLNWLAEKNFTLLFVDGNHENFDRLYAYPVKEWCGGKVHEIRPNILHLMRGQVFTIDGKKIFTFGGASSHDISGGILDPDDKDFYEKRKQLNQSGACYRINRVSWWERELATKEEMEEGLANLEKHGNEVDFIITHCCASSTQVLLSGGFYKPDKQTDYLEKIRQNTKFKRWFFGHYHDNKAVNYEELLLFDEIIRIL